MSYPYADPPAQEPPLSDCYWYHTMDVPGCGERRGEWDLREGVEDYLGHVEFAGRRVIELGTADGFLAFWMERGGAEVIALDLSPNHEWDEVPLVGEKSTFSHKRKTLARQLNNAFWLYHRRIASQVRLVYTTAYEIPDQIGPADVGVVCSVLLHLRYPFDALERITKLITQVVVVTEVFPAGVNTQDKEPVMSFVPGVYRQTRDTWWHLTPGVARAMLTRLGFKSFTASGHRACGTPLWTLVAKRS